MPRFSPRPALGRENPAQTHPSGGRTSGAATDCFPRTAPRRTGKAALSSSLTGGDIEDRSAPRSINVLLIIRIWRMTVEIALFLPSIHLCCLSNQPIYQDIEPLEQHVRIKPLQRSDSATIAITSRRLRQRLRQRQSQGYSGIRQPSRNDRCAHSIKILEFSF